eukprot:1474266-Pleurochrysis_carterae.AAC.3
MASSEVIQHLLPRAEASPQACADSSHTTKNADEVAAGICSSNLPATPVTPALLPAVPLTCSNSSQTPANINKLAAGGAAAADDDDDDAAAAAIADPPPLPPSAGRHAATYEFECIRQRQKLTRSERRLII